MDNISDAFDAAVRLHQGGQLAQAEQLYRRVLAADPQHAQALFLLGTLALQVGKADAAVELLSASIRVNGANAASHATLAEAYRALGKPADAIAGYRRALQLQPGAAEGHFNFGTLLESQGDLAEAAAQFAEALRLRPDYHEAALRLGQALFGQGKLAEAEARFEAAARARPDSAWAHCGLGVVYQMQGRLEAAIACYRRALAVAPQFAEGHYNLGSALLAQDKLVEAIACFREALVWGPKFTAAHLGLSSALVRMVRPDEAVAAARAALETAPASAPTFAHLALALQLQGNLAAAIAAYRRAVDLDPTDPVVHGNLLYALLFEPGSDPQTLFAEHRLWAERHAEPLLATAVPHENDRTPERRLRVGYVSSHFREHAVSFFSEPLIASHDPEQVEVFCYADAPRPDAVTARFRAAAHAWRDIHGMSDAGVAELVRGDKIDVLVDLAGHIGGNRLLALARKPAPVQVTYLGYQHSTGMSAIDYRLTDAHADPPGSTEAFHSEELVRLPGPFFCFRPPDPAPPVNALPAAANGYVTFASLNHIHKLTDEALATWAAILAAVPRSRLIVLAYAGGVFERRVRQLIEGVGIDPFRVEVVDKRPRYEYLQLHQRIDIALDSFPFNGHTTVCDAFWMGVPSIMLEGSSYASRFGGSAHLSLGLQDLIARTRDGYIEIAVDLAADTNRLAELRGTLRDRVQASPLVDAAGFARNVESAYRHMWRDWCRRV